MSDDAFKHLFPWSIFSTIPFGLEKATYRQRLRRKTNTLVNVFPLD